MCCSMHAARFESTVIAAWEHSSHHYLGYKNHAQNVAGFRGGQINLRGLRQLHPDWMGEDDGKPATGNAMILHFPAIPGTITPDDLLDTKDSPKILDDMVAALRPVYRGDFSRSLVIGASMGDRRVFVFESGIYTVVLADSPRDIPKALERVPANKRPPRNDVIFEAYSEWFVDWPIAVCCFNNREFAEGNPLLWRYRPRNNEYLFMPGLDAHSGQAPNLRHQVEVDHWLVASSTKMMPNNGAQVRYSSSTAGNLLAVLPTRVVGCEVHGNHPNGDFIVPVKDVRAGEFTFHRADPDRLATLYN